MALLVSTVNTNRCNILPTSHLVQLKVYTIPQQHYDTSLLYKQGHTSEVLEKTVVLLGFRISCVDRTLFIKNRPIS